MSNDVGCYIVVCGALMRVSVFSIMCSELLVMFKFVNVMFP